MEHLEHDWEQQREQLSALIDNELDEQERAELETHLPTCAECRAELESLQRTRALVRALPQPALPRSFALPLEAASLPEQTFETAAARPAPRSAQPLPSGTSARRTNRRPSLRTLQWISSIAAVLGLALLLSNAFSGVSFTTDLAGTASNALSTRRLGVRLQPVLAPQLPRQSAHPAKRSLVWERQPQPTCSLEPHRRIAGHN